jgi:hypothetical protein
MGPGVRERLPELFWLYSLGITLFWVYDKSDRTLRDLLAVVDQLSS